MNKLVNLLFLTIFFQQVFVLNVGASLKFYELISFAFLFVFFTELKIYLKINLILFILFIIIPIINLTTFPFVFDTNYYSRFSESIGTIRFDYRFTGSMILIYTTLTFCVVNYLTKSFYVHKNKEKLIRFYIYGSVLTSIYCIYAIFVNLFSLPDLIPSFLDYRNSKPTDQLRASGFSSEPGTLILSLSWSLFYLLLYKDLFSNRLRNLFLLFILIALLLTMSSLLISILFCLFINFFLLESRLRKVTITYFTLSILFLIGISVVIFDLEFIQYTFLDKLFDFISTPSDTLSSGTFRAFTSSLGFDIFLNYPLFGVGAGNSVFLMFQNENHKSIIIWGEVLTNSSYPQNSHIKLLAEYGAVGYFFFILYFSYLIKKCFENKNSSLYRVGLIGITNTLIMMTTIFPEYSLFIWIHIALLTNNLYFSLKK